MAIPHMALWVRWAKKKGGGVTLTTLLCQIFTVLAHRSSNMKLCDSRKHFIPNLSKPVTTANSGETENTNFGLTYKRRTKCWSLRLDISSRRQYLCTCTYTYAMLIFIGGMGEGLQNKIINQPNKNDEAFFFSFNTICINFSLLSLGLLSLVGKIYMVLHYSFRHLIF